MGGSGYFKQRSTEPELLGRLTMDTKGRLLSDEEGEGHRDGGQGNYCKLHVIVNLDKRRSTSLHYDICAEAKASAFFLTL